MSGDYIRISKIAIAVLVTTMMLATPFSIANDSNAYSDGSVGVFFTADDGFTVDKFITLSGLNEKDILPIISIIGFGTGWSIVSYDAEIKEYSVGEGREIKGHDKITSMFEYLSLTFKAKIVFDEPKDYVIHTNVEEGFEDLEAYLGTEGFAIGDGLTLEGSFMYYQSIDMTTTYGDVSDTKCISTVFKSSVLSRMESDVTLTYLPAGDTGTSKEFSIVQDLSLKMGIAETKTFDKDFSQLVVGDSYTNTISSYAELDPKKYNVIFDGHDHLKTYSVQLPENKQETKSLIGSDFLDSADVSIPEDMQPMGLEHLFSETQLSVSDLKSKADEFGKYGETHASFASERSNLNSKLFGEDKGGDNKLFLYIGVGAVVAVAIGGLVFFIIRRRG